MVEPNEYDLVYIGSDLFPRYVDFEVQPCTDDIDHERLTRDRWVLQKISGAWEVYDLKTLRVEFGGGYTIGLPKFVHEDFDAAVMWALIKASE